MIEFTEGSRMRTNASGSHKTEKPNIIPKGQMTNPIKTIKDADQHTNITSTYPIDDEIVTINGVKYQRIVEEPKLKHLQQIIQECFDDKKNIHTIPDIIERIEKEWTPLNLNQKEKRGFIDAYSMGFDDALDLVRKTLR